METELALSPHIEEQFVSARQQRAAATMGMWVFLATEVLFFGGLFLLYAAYRHWNPRDFAVGSRHLDVVLGTLNTCILLLSAFLMSGAVTAVRLLEKRTAIVLLLLTALLGVFFIGIKLSEWHDAWHQGFWPGTHWFDSPAHPHGVKLFFSLYYVMTGLHLVHLLIGICWVLGTARGLARLKSFMPDQNQVTCLGLYWHFVDIVWLFLYPLLYLVQRSVP